MTDQLDLLLESVREPEPADETFVRGVMGEVQRLEERGRFRSARRGMRRPMVMGIAAAVVVTGGAVAAVVGTNPSNDESALATVRPATTVQATERDGRTSAPSERNPVAAGDADPSPANTKTPTGIGYSNDHTSFIVHEATGLLLQTDTHTNSFTVGEPQRVTLTLENTGRYPIAMSASDGCPLQVMAYGDGVEAPDSSLLTDPEGRFEWVCAGSDEDPRQGDGDSAWLLAPGERRTADAYIVLPKSGAWTVSGLCRCEYKQVEPTPMPQSSPGSDPLTGTIAELGTRALPSPLLPEQPDGKNLVTPPIGVRAD